MDRMNLRWSFGLFLLAAVLVRKGHAVPLELDAASPANNSIFFSSPGVPFSLPTVTIFTGDPDVNSAGTIQVRLIVTKLAWQGESFVPGSDPLNLTNNMVDWSSRWTLNSSGIRNLRNISVLNFTVTDFANRSSLYNLSTPYSRVCFAATTSVATSVFCYRIYIRLPPVLVQSCHLGPGVDFSTPLDAEGVGCPIKPLQTSTVIAAGQTFEAWIYYQDFMRDGTETCAYCNDVEINVLSDPGVPNGALLGPTAGGPGSEHTPSDYSNLLALPADPANGTMQSIYLYSKKLSVTPDETQFLTYRMCVQGVSSSKWDLLVAMPPLMSAVTCFQIIVKPPSIRVDPRTDFGPHRVPISSPTQWPLRVRCTYTFSIYLYEEMEFSSVLDGQPPESPAAGYKRHSYQPLAAVDEHNPLPDGAVLSSPETLLVCKDRSRNCTDPSYPMRKQTLTFTPSRGMENRTFRVCLTIRDATFEAGAYPLCADWHVAVCEVCTRRGDTLQGIAQEYGTHWLQLWGANNAIPNPGVVALPSVLTLGPVYVNTAEQSPALLAQVFAMDLDRFYAVNPFLTRGAPVPVGAEVCVMNSVCS